MARVINKRSSSIMPPPQEVYELASLVSALYMAETTEEAQTRLATQQHVVVHAESRFVCVRRGKQIVLCFHGSATEATDGKPSDRTLMDWQMNMDVALAPIPGLPSGRVHRGFFQCFQSMVNKIDSIIAEEVCRDATTTLWLTGHSLGGALALLCGHHICSHYCPRIVGQTNIVTFGSPRVGDLDFARQLGKGIVHAIHNVQMELDPVISTPPVILGYAENPGHLWQLSGNVAKHHGSKGWLHSLITTAYGLFDHRISVYEKALHVASEKNI